MHNRRPHHSRPQSAYEEVQTTEGASYTDPAVLSSDQYISSSHSGPDKYKQTVSMAGYQGGMNPVFFSLDKEENRETISLKPTLTPKEYFPVQKTGTSKYWYDPPQITIKPTRVTTERYDNGNTKQMYAQPYDTTQPTEEQQGYWHDYDKVTPSLYLHQDKVWPLYQSGRESLAG